MKSLFLGKIFGIELELHWTFLLVMAFVIISQALFYPQTFLPVVFIFFILFLSVFLHELCHSVVSLSKHIKVKKIMLLPIGGVALSERMPEKPKDEFLIAIAGPLFNFLVVSVLFALIIIFNLPFPWELFNDPKNMVNFESYLIQFPLFAVLWVNFMLGAFNLFLPALPLDGGRVFRSLLALKFDYVKATRLATKVSTIFAFLLFFLGFFSGSIMLTIIAALIYLGSNQEYQLVSLKHAFSHINLSHLIKKKPFVIGETKTLKEAKEFMLKKNVTSLLVKRKLGFGLISSEDIVKQNANMGLPISNYLTELPIISATSTSSELMEKFYTTGLPFLPIVHNSKLLGVIEASSLEKLQKLHALERLK
ncbi:MAG: site-2 protease family protein [archaeon]